MHDLFFLQPKLIVVAGDVPPGSLQEDGRPLLHREEQVPPGESVQEEDHLLSGHHSGKCPLTTVSSDDCKNQSQSHDPLD